MIAYLPSWPMPQDVFARDGQLWDLPVCLAEPTTFLRHGAASFHWTIHGQDAAPYFFEFNFYKKTKMKGKGVRYLFRPCEKHEALRKYIMH